MAQEATVTNGAFSGITNGGFSPRVGEANRGAGEPAQPSGTSVPTPLQSATVAPPITADQAEAAHTE